MRVLIIQEAGMTLKSLLPSSLPSLKKLAYTLCVDQGFPRSGLLLFQLRIILKGKVSCYPIITIYCYVLFAFMIKYCGDLIQSHMMSPEIVQEDYREYDTLPFR